jgi:FdhE protein
MHCSYCGNVGPYAFTGCPICRTTDASKLGTLIPEEGEEGFRVVTCDACNSYVKTVEAGGFKGLSPDLADLVSLPLDIVAQEKGYIRHAPNPIGLTKMV